ncbi:MAG: GntR family transcriptional regulator [Nibricoccus sp.]
MSKILLLPTVINQIKQLVAGLKLGTQLPPATELAEKYKCNRSVISRALVSLEGKGLLESKDNGRGKIYYYEPRGAVKLGLIRRPQIQQSVDFFSHIAGRLLQHAASKEYALEDGIPESPAQIDYAGAHMVGKALDFVKQGVSGVFFIPLEHSPENMIYNRRIMEIFLPTKIPLVLIDSDIEPFPQRSYCDLVSMDHFHAGYTLASILCQKGHEDIIFIKHEYSAPSVTARHSGARHAWDRIGAAITVNAKDINAVSKLCREHPHCAMICANDRMAEDMHSSIRKSGYKVQVPGGITLASFDNLSWAKENKIISLSQPIDAIAEGAFFCLRDRLHRPSIPPRTLFMQVQSSFG